MSNSGWILLFAGFAIVLLLYFSGQPRKKKPRRDSGAEARKSGPPASHLDTGSLDMAPGHDVLMDPSVYSADTGAGYAHPQAAPLPATQPALDPYQRTVPQGRAQEGRAQSGSAAEGDSFNAYDMFGAVDPDDLARPAGAGEDVRPRGSAAAGGQPQEGLRQPQGPNSAAELAQNRRGSIGEKIGAFGALLTPKRKSRVAASEEQTPAGSATGTKIVSLHVVAPGGKIIRGQHLLNTFESRGYHYGDMNIYHSLHNGSTVFSIARMVVPGTFDLNDIGSFDTPGITLFLQLPGPVPGDVAFKVLLSEAKELATALGCNILDSDRSTLSRQTEQHLREGVAAYMHRQKYFNQVPG